MSALFIHKRNAIVLFFTDREGTATIPLPEEALSDMDVRSEEAYLSTIGKVFGKKVTPAVPSVLILADELCYVAQAKPEDAEAKTKELIENTPFTHVETVSIRTPTLTYIIATNADMYETAARVLSSFGYTVTNIIPWAALTYHKVSTGGEVDKITVKRTFDALGTLKAYSFPLTVHEHIESTTEKASSPVQNGKKKGLPVGWIIFGTLALLYGIGMMWYMTRQ